MSERRESLPERSDLRLMIQALAILIDAADKLPEGSERLSAIKEIAGFHEKVKRLLISA